MAGESVTVREAGDKILLTMDGNMQLTAVVIDNELLAPEKKDKLQNAIKDAHNEALKKMQRVMATKMQEMGGFEGLGLK